MARTFTTGSQYGAATAASFTGNSFTAACWFKIVALGSFHGILTTRDSGMVGLATSGAGGTPLTASWNNGSGEFSAATGLTITTGVWMFGAMVVTPTTMDAYLGQAGGSLSTFHWSQTNNSRTLAAWTLGNDSFSLTDRMMNGDLAEAALWSAALTMDELNGLLAGRLPPRVRPASRFAYWPLWGLSSPEPDLSGNAGNATLNNTPAAANHAPVTLLTAKARSEFDAGGAAPPASHYLATLGVGA